MEQRAVNPRRAFLMMDTLLGLAVVTVLLTALLIAVAHQRKGERLLQQHRAEFRHAEDAANALLAGQPLPEGARLEVLPAPDGSAVPAGRAWVRLTLGKASLVALAPKNALQNAATSAPSTTIAPAGGAR
jgi:hypothetical protein